MPFSALGLDAPIVDAILAEGYAQPTPIQAQAIPHVIAGRDLLGSAQTGTGKTAAFALPVLHRLLAGGVPKRFGRPVRTLVLSPTRELASQIGESFAVYGGKTRLRHTTIYGGVSQFPQTQALKNGVDVLIATPGRLVDLINQGYVHLQSVEMFVLDEADRMLDMGFLPDLRRIIDRLPVERQTLFFSATMPPAIDQLAQSILRDPVRIEIAPVQSTTELIEQSVCFVPRQQKTQLLAHLLEERKAERAIVFTRTKHGADRVVRSLLLAGIQADALHGNKTQAARQRILNGFKTNRIRVLVATDVAARGIDVDGITHVFNYDLPEEPETYVHRIGRTGRAGATGIAIAFCDEEERRYLRSIERLLKLRMNVERIDPRTLPRLPVVAGADDSHQDADLLPERGGRPAGPLASRRPPRQFQGQTAPVVPQESRPSGEQGSYAERRSQNRSSQEGRPGGYGQGRPAQSRSGEGRPAHGRAGGYGQQQPQGQSSSEGRSSANQPPRRPRRRPAGAGAE